MPAGVFSGHGKRRIGFFRETHLKLNGFPSVIQHPASAINDQRVFGVHQVAVVAGQLLHRFLKGFLIAGESNHKITVRYEPGFLQPNEQCCKDGHVKLVVQHPAAIEKGVVFLQLKGVS